MTKITFSIFDSPFKIKKISNQPRGHWWLWGHLNTISLRAQFHSWQGFLLTGPAPGSGCDIIKRKTYRRHNQPLDTLESRRRRRDMAWPPRPRCGLRHNATSTWYVSPAGCAPSRPLGNIHFTAAAGVTLAYNKRPASVCVHMCVCVCAVYTVLYS